MIRQIDVPLRISPSNEDITQALKSGVLSRTFAPVLCGSAIKDIGIDKLMSYVN